MRVALVSYLYPTLLYSGASLYAFNLAKALSKYADVTVVVPDKSDSRLPALDQQAKTSRVDFINAPFLRSPSFMLMAARHIRQQDFDIIHSNSGDGLFCPFISVETFHHRADTFGAFVHGLPQSFCLRRASQVLAVSQRSKHELEEMRINDRKITVVENGVDTDTFSFQACDPQELKRFLGLPDTRLVLNVNTELSRRKNLPLMLATFQRLRLADPEVKLILIGSRSGRESVIETLRALNLEKDVFYVSGVPPTLMPQYYRAAEFLAVPSLKEGFGLPMLESIAVGKPFVSLDVGIASALSQQGFGRVATGEEDFMEKCAEMLTHPFVFGERGFTMVQERFSWDICARKTIEVYHKAMRAAISSHVGKTGENSR